MAERTTATSNGAVKNEQITITPTPKVVDASTPFETILEWDRQGERIIFAHEKGSFKELSDTEQMQLSAYTKAVYSMMRELNRKHDPEGDAFAHKFQVTGTPNPYGGPLGRITGPKVAEGLKKTLVRPDQIDETMGRGWRYPKPEEVLGGIKQREGHFEIQFPSTGLTEQVLLVKDKEQSDADAWDFTRRRIAVGEEKSDAIREEINKSGVAVAKDAD